MKIVEFKDYDNQTTPLSAYNLNRLQQNLITTKYQMTFSSAVSGGSTITLPCYYQVGQDTLDVYLNSELLKKASTKDSEGHYYEVGNSDKKSNQIKITSDWSIASGDVLNLIVRGTTDSYDQNLSPDKATQLADEISANKEEITALQTENSRLKGITNALPKISGEDTSLTLTNTANTPFNNIILKGNTSQQQYSGINLLNNDIYTTTQNGITIQHDDNSVTINGTNTGKAFKWDYKSNITFKANTNYTVYIKVISGNFKPFNSNSDWAAIFYIEEKRIPIDNKSSNFIMNFTPTEDIEVRPFFWFGWDSNSVQGQDGVFNNFKLQIMIVEGNYTSSTIPSYEPYVGGVPSPNPDYPQDIEVVTGDNTINVINKNLLKNQLKSGSLNGITYVVNDNGSITLNGTATNQVLLWLTPVIWKYDTSLIVLEPGTYTISFNNNIIDGLLLFANYYNKNNKDILGKAQKIITYKILTLTEEVSANYRLQINKGTTLNNVTIYPMIEKGSTKTDYISNKQQSFPINLGSLELCKIGNYQDYIYKNDGKWYKHKVIDKNTLNGTEKWHFGKNKTNFTIIYTSSFRNDIKIPANNEINSNTLIYCDKFSNNTTANQQWGNDTMSSVTINDGKNITFNIPNSIATTLDEFKTYLSSNNTIIYYVLAAPTEEEIIDTTLISQLNALERATSYDDTTNISQTNANLPFIINAEAFKKIS